MVQTLTELVREHAGKMLIALAWYLIAGLIAFVFARKTRIDAWCVAHPWTQLLLNILRSTGLDVWKLLAAFKNLADAQTLKTAARVTGVGLLLLLVSGCSSMPWAKSAYDDWRTVCGRDLMGRADIRAEAAARKLDVSDFAEALCELSDVVAPFMRANGAANQSRDPSAEAVAVARAKGLVR